MKRVLIAIGVGLLGLLGLLVAVLLVLNLISFSRQQKTYRIDVQPVTVPTDSASLERGRHLVTTVGACAECHGPDLGGMVLMDNIAMGRLVAPNLTSGKGGAGAVYSNEDFIRAIRHGVGRDGKSLIFMPSEGYQALTDVDLAAVIAYLRSVSPVDKTTSGRNPGPLARALHVAVGLPLLPAEKIDHSARGSSTVPGASVPYGEYLANLSGCRGCHGPALAGGAGPGPNITRGVIGSWSEQEFGRAVREGRRPDGRTISSQMPWKAYARMTDEEVRALHMYVLSLPAVAPRGK